MTSGRAFRPTLGARTCAAVPAHVPFVMPTPPAGASTLSARSGYELYNINRARLENLLPRVFAPARLDIDIVNRFGQPVVPREWFLLVPLFIVHEVIEKIRDGTITGYSYDPQNAVLRRQDEVIQSR